MNTLDILIQRLAEERGTDGSDLRALLAPSYIGAVLNEEFEKTRAKYRPVDINSKDSTKL
jgi:hypothetical protein